MTLVGLHILLEIYGKNKGFRFQKNDASYAGQTTYWLL